MDSFPCSTDSPIFGEGGHDEHEDENDVGECGRECGSTLVKSCVVSHDKCSLYVSSRSFRRNRRTSCNRKTVVTTNT